VPQYYKDAFAKEHARIIGEGLGEFDNNLSISTETLDFDVLFIPNSQFLAQDNRNLDLYCRLLQTDSVVIIPELEKSPDTLWLRTLGKEKILTEAFLETIDLPFAHPKRNAIIDLGRSYFNFLSEIEVPLSEQADCKVQIFLA
jgi:hypothetical protein